VIADHLRSISFLIADGVMPSNDGRGYVLRRIMRRAMRHAHKLGTDAPLMHRLVGALIGQMGAHYPELGRARALTEETLRLEETRFRQTLDRGLRLLDDEVAKLPEGAALPGDAAFRLYDTYGFPLDLTQDALREQGRSVDIAGFEAAMAEQKARARAHWAGTGEAAGRIWFELAEEHGPTEFLGYETETAEGADPGLVLRTAKPWPTRRRAIGADHAQPDPVLCRGRRAGGRYRPAGNRCRPGPDHQTRQGGGRVRPPCRDRGGHACPRGGGAADGRSRPARRDPGQPFRDPSDA
jgi:hypothetical protein